VYASDSSIDQNEIPLTRERLFRECFNSEDEDDDDDEDTMPLPSINTEVSF
jgi:hypothetical protein